MVLMRTLAAWVSVSRSRQVAAHQALDPGAPAQFEEAGLLQTFPRRHDAFAAAARQGRTL
jgi:hypothetical protein